MFRYFFLLAMSFILSTSLCMSQVRPKMVRTPQAAVKVHRTNPPQKKRNPSVPSQKKRNPSVPSQKKRNPSVPSQKKRETTSTRQPHYETPSPCALSVIPNKTTFTYDGGKVTVFVSCNYDWTYTLTAGTWANVIKEGKNLVLSVDPNTDQYSRSGYLTIRSEDKVQRIEFSQAAVPVSARINKVWIEHNEYCVTNNGAVDFSNPGMRIHANYGVTGMYGQDIYYCIEFFNGSYSMPIRNRRGQNLMYYSRCRANYVSTIWNDNCIFVPYRDLNMPKKVSNVPLLFDVVIRDADAKQLTRSANHKFYFNNTKKARRRGRMSW